MRIVFAVFFLLIAYVASYPTYHDSETNNDENNFELELRSILNQLDEEQMTRSLTTDEENDDDDDDDDDQYAFSKRQGGLNKIDKQSDCEIKCIYNERNPPSGKGKTIKEAAKVCKSKCPFQKKRGDKKIKEQKKEQHHKKLNLREFVDDDDDSSNDSEEQQTQRRQFYDYLMQQLQQNNDE